jgi:phosphate transport system substrate-binding protein
MRYNYGLQPIQMLNHANQYVLPSLQTMAAAAKQMNWASISKGVIDAEDLNAWPLTGTSYILLPKQLKSDELGKYHALLMFIQWCLEFGEEEANHLGYVMNPPVMQQQILRVLHHPFTFIQDD